MAGMMTCSAANALTVTGGQLIKKSHPQALLSSAELIANDFFDDQALVGLDKVDTQTQVALSLTSLLSNTFTYAIHSPSFVTDLARSIGINSYPSQFSFSSHDVLRSAGKGRIGLGGMMRYDLPIGNDGRPRYFMVGDFTLEYEQGRKSQVNPAVSGWILRNHFDFPMISYDILNATVMTGSDSFYLSGQLGWSPEMTAAFLTEDSTYRVVSDFVMCAKDDNASTAGKIPCVFPKMSVNGVSGQASVSSSRPYALTVDLGVATAMPIDHADYFVAFVSNGVTYWLNQRFQWTTAAAPAYQGALFDFKNIALPNPRLPTGAFVSGSSITVYFGVDSVQNGVFDAPNRLTSMVINY